jgi:hypothetical protein
VSAFSEAPIQSHSRFLGSSPVVSLSKCCLISTELSLQLVEEVKIQMSVEMETSKASGVIPVSRGVNARCNADFSSVDSRGVPWSSDGRLWSPASHVQGLRDSSKVLRRSLFEHARGFN